jgi:acyl carrier protein
VVVHEVGQRYLPDATAVAATVREALAGEHDVEPHAVVLIRGGTLPRTSSGKVRRPASREAFLAGALEVIGEWREGTRVTDAPAVLTRDVLLASAPARRQALLEFHFQARLARALGLTPEQIDLRQSPAALGLESLTAAELKNAIESDLGVALPVTSFFQVPTLAELAARVLALLPATPAPGRPRSARLPRQVEPHRDAAPAALASDGFLT